MATTKIWDVQDSLGRVLNYAMNPLKTENPEFYAALHGLEHVLEYTTDGGKTEQQLFVSGVNCFPDSALEEMQDVKLAYGKTGGILAFHAVQSFAPGETSPQQAHEIGVKLARELWGDRFQVIVSTHLDKDHLHNHFVLNSVSFADGKKYYDDLNSYLRMRRASDRLCREYSLSVIENPKPGKSKQYAEWMAEKQGKPTWRSLIRDDLDPLIARSRTWSQFLSALKESGYEVKTDVKYVAVRPPGKPRFTRLKTLGLAYTEDAIKDRILQNIFTQSPEVVPEPKLRRVRLRGNFKDARKLTGLQALYFSYLYKLGVLPRHRPHPKRVHPLLREDVLKLDAITDETRLLCSHHIREREQLLSFQSDSRRQMEGLAAQRKGLYHRIRRCGDPEQKAAYQSQIAGLSKEIAIHRKEVRLCEDILTRSAVMQDKLAAVKEEQERKEGKSYESRSRRSRSGHENDVGRH